MSIIDTQNGKQIRDAMEVHCGLTARYTKADLSITAQSGQIAAADSNNDCKLTIADVLVTLQTILN